MSDLYKFGARANDEVLKEIQDRLNAISDLRYSKDREAAVDALTKDIVECLGHVTFGMLAQTMIDVRLAQQAAMKEKHAELFGGAK